MRTLPAGWAGWVWLGIACLAIGGLSLLRSSSTPAPALSAASADPKGALALHLWLQRLGYHVQVAQDQLPRLRAGGSRETLVIASQGAESGDANAEAEIGWLLGGGTVLVVTDGSTAGPLVSALGLRIVPALAAAVEIRQPLLLAPPASTLSAYADAVLDVPPGAGVAGTSEGAVLLEREYGRGRLWILTAPTLLDNADIALAGNRKLAINLVGPAGTTVVFDEVSGGSAPGSTASWLTGTSWGVVILSLIALLVLYRWLSGWRLGPPAASPIERRRASTEYVISMAGLLRRGRKRSEVLKLYQRSLRRSLHRRFGGPQTRPDVDGLLAARATSDAELVRQAAAIVEEERTMGRDHD